jgi:hypothetical protein
LASAILTAAILFHSGCAGAAKPPEVAVEQREWTSPVKTNGVQLLTEHYDIRTTVEDTLLRDYLPTFMETCWTEYAKLVPAAKPRSERLVVYVFGRRPEWAAFTKGFVPAQSETYLHIHSGGYMDQATATAVLFEIGRDRTLSLMAHEGLHQYLAGHLSEPVPPWLNEGLATQFEDFDLDGARPIFRPERNLMRKNSLRESLSVDNGLIPLPELLGMDAGRAVTKTGQTARGYYAQIWATILFLRTSPQYRDGFARLLGDAGTPRLRQNLSAYRAATPAAANMSQGEILFRQYVTEDLEAFGDEFKVFAGQLVYH